MNWLDIIPVLPLARGVPLVQLHVAGPPVTRGWVALGPDTCTLPSDDPSCTFLGNANSIDRGFMRVDLDDPQGVAYAAAYWLRLMVERGEGVDAIKQYQFWMQRCALGEITDADRLALAKALRDVTPQPKTRTTEA